MTFPRARAGAGAGAGAGALLLVFAATAAAFGACGGKTGEEGSDAGADSGSGSGGGAGVSSGGGSGGSSSSGGSSGAGSGSSSGSPTTSSSSGGSPDATVPTPACPPVPPTDGTPCSPAPGGSECEYGGDANRRCTTLASCAFPTTPNGPSTWKVVPPAPTCGVNPPGCPPTLEAGAVAFCPAGLGTCEYAGGACGCQPCVTDAGSPGGGLWTCRTYADVAPGCPNPRPLLGTACSAPEGTECYYDYDACCTGASLGPGMICTGGTWRWRGIGGECACGIPVCP
jgi:hypothetical protein